MILWDSVILTNFLVINVEISNVFFSFFFYKTVVYVGSEYYCHRWLSILNSY